MTTYVLIHGAGSDAWYWHRVVPELRARGHAVVAPDLPSDDDSAGLTDYADAVLEALDQAPVAEELVVVAQSMGGFIAPLVCERVKVDLMVLVAAMVPSPHELLEEWWTNTGWKEARREQAEEDGRSSDSFDAMTDFFHDVPADVVREALARGERKQSGTPFKERWPLDVWPDVPTRFILCRDDRFFPKAFMRRVVRERLGIVPDEMDSGHLPALSRPRELTERLETYRLEAASQHSRTETRRWGVSMPSDSIRVAATDDDILRCFPVMSQLRPHLLESAFVARVKLQAADGFQLAYLEEAGMVRAVAGFRIVQNLSSGRILYVDDLVTDEARRSAGHGAQLLRWLAERARAETCAQLHLDSGVQRVDAHRFYLTNGMEISAYHFRMGL